MLSTILEKINEVRPVAEEEIDEINFPQTLAARLGRKRQAVEQMTQLKREYIREMLRSAVFVVVAGSEAASFNKAAEKFGTFTGSSQDLYEELAEKISPHLLEGRENTKYLFDVLTRAMEEKAHELELASYNQLQFNETFNQPITTRQEFADMACAAISEQVGSEIVGINAAYKLADKAIAAQHGSRLTPIALTAPDSYAVALASDLRRITPRVGLVVAGEASPNLKGAADVVTKVMSAGKVQRKKNQTDEEYAAAQANATQTVINEKAVEDALVQIKKSLAK